MQPRERASKAQVLERMRMATPRKIAFGQRWTETLA